jgi:hypothetical protein
MYQYGTFQKRYKDLLAGLAVKENGSTMPQVLTLQSVFLKLILHFTYSDQTLSIYYHTCVIGFSPSFLHFSFTQPTKTYIQPI